MRETAREVYSILDRAAPVWSPNRGRRFHAKEPERRGKAVVFDIFADKLHPPYEKRLVGKRTFLQVIRFKGADRLQFLSGKNVKQIVKKRDI